MKILVIEDDPPIRQTLSELLEANGMEPLLAADGVEGLELLKKRPDLILCDLAMPRMDGYEVISTIRSKPEWSALPIIVLSAKTGRADLLRAMEMGADDFITKPFVLSDVMTAIETLLARVQPLPERLEASETLHQNNIPVPWSVDAMDHFARILGGADLILTDADRLAPAEVMEIASSIKSHGILLRGMVAKMQLHMELERLAGPGEKIPEGCANALGVIDQASRRVAARAERSGDLTIDLKEAQLQLPEQWLIIAVEELVENALSFSRKGTPVSVAGTLNQNQYTLRITNRGRLLDPAQVDSIGPLVRFHGKASGKQGGLGLGLSNVTNLARLFGGRLELIPSISSEGMCAELTLPACPEGTTAKPEETGNRLPMSH